MEDASGGSIAGDAPGGGIVGAGEAAVEAGSAHPAQIVELHHADAGSPHPCPLYRGVAGEAVDGERTRTRQTGGIACHAQRGVVVVVSHHTRTRVAAGSSILRGIATCAKGITSRTGKTTQVAWGTLLRISSIVEVSGRAGTGVRHVERAPHFGSATGGAGSATRPVACAALAGVMTRRASPHPRVVKTNYTGTSACGEWGRCWDLGPPRERITGVAMRAGEAFASEATVMAGRTHQTGAIVVEPTRLVTDTGITVEYSILGVVASSTKICPSHASVTPRSARLTETASGDVLAYSRVASIVAFLLAVDEVVIRPTRWTVKRLECEIGV